MIKAQLLQKDGFVTMAMECRFVRDGPLGVQAKAMRDRGQDPNEIPKGQRYAARGALILNLGVQSAWGFAPGDEKAATPEQDYRHAVHWWPTEAKIRLTVTRVNPYAGLNLSRAVQRSLAEGVRQSSSSKAKGSCRQVTPSAHLPPLDARMKDDRP